MAKLLALDPTYKQKNEQYIAEDLSFMSDFDLHKMCTEYRVFYFLFFFILFNVNNSSLLNNIIFLFLL